MSHITIFITNEEALEFASGDNDVVIEGQDKTDTYFFTCSLNAITSYKARSLIYFSLDDHGLDFKKVFNKKRVLDNTPADNDARHTILRDFLFECSAELFLIGFYVTGSYEYDGQTWAIQGEEPSTDVVLPYGFEST